MEELEATLASCTVTFQPNSTAAPHPHFSLYKSKQTASSQEERRRKFLEAQKAKRFDFVNHARALATEMWENDSGEEYENEDMDCGAVPNRLPRYYKDQLMLSEWLVTVPDDLASNWYLVLCPIGKRSLVVASKKYTKAYSRGGHLLNSFPSNLPGGNKHHYENRPPGRATTYTLLDCIYVAANKTYYILDIMCWNGHQVYDCDTEFRFYWTGIKVKENPEVSEKSSSNPYRFIPLPYYNCDKETIKNVLSSPLPFSCQLDGLLFFHKKTQYMPGPTPLICWLKAYMVPEMLNIDVPSELCFDKPASYTTMKEHLPKVFEKEQERKEKDQQIMLYDEINNAN